VISAEEARALVRNYRKLKKDKADKYLPRVEKYINDKVIRASKKGRYGVILTFSSYGLLFVDTETCRIAAIKIAEKYGYTFKGSGRIFDPIEIYWDTVII